MVFWHKAWLRPASANDPAGHTKLDVPPDALTLLNRATTVDGERRYRCQLTAIRNMGTPLNNGPIGELWHELRVGNLSLIDIRAQFSFLWNRLILKLCKRLPLARNGTCNPDSLGLVPGDIVQVRDRAELLGTLDHDYRHRGLKLNLDMLRFAGKNFRVVAKIERFIDEDTGEMRNMKHPCVALQDVICGGGSYLCPRAQYWYWREVWLNRVPASAIPPENTNPAHNISHAEGTNPCCGVTHCTHHVIQEVSGKNNARQ
jgi:hypothetical protein